MGEIGSSGKAVKGEETRVKQARCVREKKKDGTEERRMKERMKTE